MNDVSMVAAGVKTSRKMARNAEIGLR